MLGNDHQRAAELHDGAAHAHHAGAQQGKQDHSSGHEQSRRALEHAGIAGPRTSHAATSAHGISTFGHAEIAALAHELWQARGCPEGSPQEDWFQSRPNNFARETRLEKGGIRC